MTSRASSPTPNDERKQSESASSKDGLDRVELSDLDSSPPRAPLAVEQDLMQLARLGELRSIQKLFDSGKFNARWTDEQGITALHWAAINGHYALCHFLLQSGADVNAVGGDAAATPVLWASKRCNLQVVSLLLANGADPLMRDDQGYNLLHSATLDGNVFQLIMLLHHPDLPVDVPDGHGHTSLMWAAYKGFGACVDVLLRWGADVHAVDEQGFTALHWALVKGSYMCIQKLVECGSDRFLPARPQEGQTVGDTPAVTASKMKSDRQWRKALADSGFDEEGNAVSFPIPGVTDRRRFFRRFFFFWPFVLGGLQLYMLAHLMIWLAIPSVFIVGYGLQFLVQKSLRWAPSNMKTFHRTPLMAGIFAGSLFWVGMRYVFHILPATFFSHFFLNAAFIVCYVSCTYFYALTMTADPGFIPKGGSRGQMKKIIDNLVENNAFDEKHFCSTCMIRKPLRSKHCRRCGRCVAKEDHHCPWVDNCIGVNNHKHFLLYVIFMIGGLALNVQLTLAYLSVLPEPTELHCTLINDALCAQFTKDPMTIVTSLWATLQLTWTFMLVFVHLTQVARGITTLETMRGMNSPGPIVAAMAAGTMDAADASLTEMGAGPDPVARGGHQHTHGRKKEGCLSQWYKLLGMDTFFTIAFQGYKDRRAKKRASSTKDNPFTRGLLRNCQDFWTDGPLLRHKENGRALLGGEPVNYTAMYEVPRGTGMQYRGAYESVPLAEEGEAE